MSKFDKFETTSDGKLVISSAKVGDVVHIKVAQAGTGDPERNHVHLSSHADHDTFKVEGVTCEYGEEAEADLAEYVLWKIAQERKLFDK